VDPINQNINRRSERIAGLFFIGWGFITICLFAGLAYITPFILYFGLFAVAGIVSGEAVLFSIIFFLLLFEKVICLIFNATLSINYLRHFRGTLDKHTIDRLWTITILYNAIFFFPAVYLALQCVIGQQCFAECRPFGDCNWLFETLSGYSNIFFTMTLWWGVGTFLPFAALLAVDEDVEC
jgi:hypothetical protein